MLIDEKIFNSKELSKKIEFITLQSSERRDEEIRYKNIKRKLIIFDLNDIQTMIAVGRILAPYGMKENFENKMLESKVAAFRIWAEKRIAKRAENFLRELYLKYPEKFSKVEYSHSKRKNMKLLKANYILSELVSQKSIGLKDLRSDSPDDLSEFKERFANEQKGLFHQENIMKELVQDSENSDQTLLEMQSE